jgi:hypothetical protein
VVFDVSLTGTLSSDTPVDYAVVDGGAGFLGGTTFAGSLHAGDDHRRADHRRRLHRCAPGRAGQRAR